MLLRASWASRRCWRSRPRSKNFNKSLFLMGGCLPRWSGTGSMTRPRLAGATIGISMSDSSHLAMQTADVVLMGQGLRRLPAALELGRYTFATIRGNLFWAFAYNVIAIPVAAFGGLVPAVAALAMGFSDVVLAANSLRLYTKKISRPDHAGDNHAAISGESLLMLLRQHWRYTRLPAAAGSHYSIGAGGEGHPGPAPYRQRQIAVLSVTGPRQTWSLPRGQPAHRADERSGRQFAPEEYHRASSSTRG